MKNPFQPAKPAGKVAGCFLIVFALFWSTFVLAIDTVLITAAVRQIKAANFTSTSARITQSEVKTSRGNKGRTNYDVRIVYQYSVAGVTYTGTRYRYSSISGSDESWATATVAAYPAGSDRTIYYDPERPGESLLRPGIEGVDLFLALFITPFNVVMIALWWSAMAAFRKSAATPENPGFRLLPEPGQLRARLTNWDAPAVALVALGAGAFLGIFLVAFTQGAHPSLRFMGALGFSLVLLSVAAGVWHAMRVRSGHFDLVLNLGAHTLTLPATEGRKSRRTLGWNQIQSVENRIQQSRKRNTPCKIVLHTNGEGPAAEIVFTTYNEAKARGLAHWLREHLNVTGEG